MSLINIENENEDSWLSECSALERLTNQIQRQISDRDAQKTNTGEKY
jgi:hypothetical protein